MFTDDEILGLVKQARASCSQASAPPGAVGAPTAGLTIDPALKEKFKAILLGMLQLIFAQFMTAAPVSPPVSPPVAPSLPPAPPNPMKR